MILVSFALEQLSAFFCGCGIYHIDIFKEYGPDVSQNSPRFGFFSWFLMIRSSDYFWQEHYPMVFWTQLVSAMRANSHIFSQCHVLWCHTGSLKWANVGGFTSWISTNATNQGSPLYSYPPITVCETFTFIAQHCIQLCPHRIPSGGTGCWSMQLLVIFHLLVQTVSVRLQFTMKSNHFPPCN